MILYHFTAAHLWADIKKEGVTMGTAPVLKYPKISWSKKYRWLTANPDFRQSWCGNQILLRYSRTDVRIKLLADDSNLIKWIDYCEPKKDSDLVRALNGRGDPENWYLYKGDISPERFMKIDFQRDQ